MIAAYGSGTSTTSRPTATSEIFLLPLVEKVFAWTRKINPTQPLTVGTWNGNAELNDIIFSHSDIITFHNYNQADALRNAVTELKKHGRPVINTEWLNRPTGSLVETCLPIFATENVGCMHWGLVNGRTQTHLASGAQPGSPAPARWQHDLFHADHSPYAPAEIALFLKRPSAVKSWPSNATRKSHRMNSNSQTK